MGVSKMVYLKRKIDGDLAEWKARANHKPLIVQGARQIGKTASIRKFARENYESFVEINFILEPKYRKITETGYGPAEIINNISRIDPEKKFIPGKTVIFFDEVQDFPDIVTSLKFFKEDGKYDVICSGSMLGINYKRISSNSVGYKEDYKMYSMNFEEFLWAKKYGNAVIQDMLRHMQELKKFSLLEMDTYKNLFLDYCILGGMPEIVANYIDQGNFQGTLRLQRQLLLDYEEDIRKYLTGLEQTKVLNVYRQLPAQLAKEYKKFQITKVAHGARNSDYAGCIEWLKDAGIINICYCLNFPELPLKGNFNENIYKLYFQDTGFLVASLDDEAQEDLRTNKNLGVYKGAIYENMVADGLSKEGYNLYYYKRDNSTLEEDFFLRTKKNLIPVEVKAGQGKAKFLQTLIADERYKDVVSGIKLSSTNVGVANDIYTFPYFCTFLLKRYLQGK